MDQEREKKYTQTVELLRTAQQMQSIVEDKSLKPPTYESSSGQTSLPVRTPPADPSTSGQPERPPSSSSWIIIPDPPVIPPSAPPSEQTAPNSEISSAPTERQLNRPVT